MKERIVAKRYARALFELSLEKGNAPRVAEEMQALSRASAELPTLIKGLSDERFDAKVRIAAAGAICESQGFSKETENAVKLLVERNRAGLIPAVAQDLTLRLEKHEKLSRGKLTAASREEAKKAGADVEKILSEALGLKAVCETEADEELLGGFSLCLGDVRYDASIRGKLERMKERLK
ncbi:MAG TPA: ATP synthase F1 subunit delta [bacterium]|nr:ATP synthase F1 subunit delta [bacterium]